MFDHVNQSGDMPTELDAVLALAYIARQSLASLNAQAWINDPVRKALRASIDKQIKANADSRKAALWYRMLHGDT